MIKCLNRYDMAKIIGPLTGLETVGGLMHPDTPWGLSPEELQELPGFEPHHSHHINRRMEDVWLAKQ